MLHSCYLFTAALYRIPPSNPEDATVMRDQESKFGPCPLGGRAGISLSCQSALAHGCERRVLMLSSECIQLPCDVDEQQFKMM